MSGQDDDVLRRGLLLTVLVVCAAYIGVIGLGFVWDDRALVLDNPHIQDFRQVPRFFLTDLWSLETTAETSGYYRPLMSLSLAVDYALFELEPAGYHLHNLLWHLLACGALAALLREMVPPKAALVGVAVFALHPVQSEAVVWVAARNDPMAAAYALAALALVVDREARGWRLPVAGGMAALALLAKESVLLLPLMLVALDLGRGGMGRRRRYVALIIGMGATLTLRAFSAVGGAVLPTIPAIWMALERAPIILAQLGSLLVWPSHLSGAYSIEWLTLPPERTLLGALALVALLGLPLRLSPDRQRLAIAGLMIAVMAYLPAVLPIMSKGLLGERYLYLPMAGLVLWLGSVIPQPRILAVLLVVPLCVFRIQTRLADWSDERVLWESAVRDVPGPFSHTGLAHSLNSDTGDRGRALQLFLRSLQDPLPYRGACGAPITTAFNSGRAALAVQIGWWSLSRGCPEDGDFNGRMAVALATAGDWEQAETLLSTGLEDVSGRSSVVRAALYRRSGDEAGYDRIREAWTGQVSLDEQVQSLLGRNEVLPEEH